MYKKALCLSLLLATSPAIMADSFYHIEPTPTKTHHEATNGSVGLIIGSLAAGPLGALIGGSLGVITGNNQTKSETISQQERAISDLENELSSTMTKLSQSREGHEKVLDHVKTLENTNQHTQQQHRAELIEFSNSYQFDIYFMTNSHIISQHSQQGLLKLAELLQNNEHIYANIEAHSDWRGSSDANCRLAKQRLSAVTEQLVQAGSHSEQLLATSYGEQASVHLGSWGDELFYDRRVTITLNYFE